jgi:hypothetical protein
MMAAKKSNEEKEFDRECLAAKNRLEDISVRDITTRKITERGESLTKDDLRTLAIIVEEQESLDPMLGLYIDGVSRTVVREIMEIDGGSAYYRFSNLVEAGLIEEHVADELPGDPTKGGSDPKYAVPTRRGKEIVENLELIPILTRDRDMELVMDQLLSVVANMHDNLLTTMGRQASLMKELDTRLDVEFDLMQYDFTEFGLQLGSLEEEPAFLQSREHDLLLGEMDSMEREVVISKLLDEDDR